MEALEKKEVMAIVEGQVGPQDYLSGLQCLQDFLLHVRKTTKPYRVLQAWLDYEIQRVGDGHDTSSYKAENLRACFGETSDKPASGWLAPIWKVLQGLDEMHGEGLRSWTVQQGHSGFCLPAKQASQGGSGNTSKYFFRYIAATQKQTASNQSAVSATDTSVQYIMDTQIQPAWWVGGLLKSRFKLYGWRKWLFLAYCLISFIAVGCYLFLSFLSIVYDQHGFSDFIKVAGSAVGVGVMGFLCLGPYVQLVNWRITMAPLLFTAFNEVDHAQLELVTLSDDPSGAKREIRLVRYSAQCPICSARVLLRRGGRQFPHRLVGRCEESPAEHVFSFDRSNLSGRHILQWNSLQTC
ncbi:hypothetical protein B0T49_21945 [Chromobacterium violaceum]|uniref:hypothetical protein n=1 Tax=Chromobacterium violaceum TaxID=536 RepID=UPI0009F03429|nr:hypothetical protein [Chromobacterium violaceum]OQS45009.1 hypothetical protein B0T49_21945 [Chromobacterium violaceum]OQS47024.1 hypothetical protein B0T48_14660 [Chromobacterium violaceum]